MLRKIAAFLMMGAFMGVQAQGTKALLLFGGDDHKTFLGCLNCNKYDSGSICNKYGEHGSKYAGQSIWNKYGEFGSRYSSESPWNQYASNPPVIVDREGDFYGYLTANKSNPQRTRIPLYVALTDAWEKVTDDPMAIADQLCDR